MNNKSSDDIPLWKALLILFIALKLCGVIAWRWMWVLSPLWIQIILACINGMLNAIMVKEDD